MTQDDRFAATSPSTSTPSTPTAPRTTTRRCSAPTVAPSTRGARGTRTDERLSRGEYEHRKRLLQIELLKLQAWVKDTGQKVVLLFEGRDAAGKGGTIKR